MYQQLNKVNNNWQKHLNSKVPSFQGRWQKFFKGGRGRKNKTEK